MGSKNKIPQQMKLIDLHKEWCENNRIGDLGLCHSLTGLDKESFNLFYPTAYDTIEGDSVFWAAGESGYNDTVHYGYTPLRQTIVLLICAMNNEL